MCLLGIYKFVVIRVISFLIFAPLELLFAVSHGLVGWIIASDDLPSDTQGSSHHVDIVRVIFALGDQIFSSRGFSWPFLLLVAQEHVEPSIEALVQFVKPENGS
jgi:hypothetical protein